MDILWEKYKRLHLLASNRLKIPKELKTWYRVSYFANWFTNLTLLAYYYSMFVKETKGFRFVIPNNRLFALSVAVGVVVNSNFIYVANKVLVESEQKKPFNVEPLKSSAPVQVTPAPATQSTTEKKQ